MGRLLPLMEPIRVVGGGGGVFLVEATRVDEQAQRRTLRMQGPPVGQLVPRKKRSRGSALPSPGPVRPVPNSCQRG